ncbi:MAG: hypothetical protein KBC50_02915 [Candidatus Pacebacteria bacterium]|nr:hypothetical protein [Candidatus Paceibacterota bacterium]
MNKTIMNSERKKLILRYAMLTAESTQPSQDAVNELQAIEDQLHLPKESILRQATELALATYK